MLLPSFRSRASSGLLELRERAPPSRGTLSHGALLPLIVNSFVYLETSEGCFMKGSGLAFSSGLGLGKSVDGVFWCGGGGDASELSRLFGNTRVSGDRGFS